MTQADRDRIYRDALDAAKADLYETRQQLEAVLETIKKKQKYVAILKRVVRALKYLLGEPCDEEGSGG